MNKLSKYVNALFLAAGALAWLITQHYAAVFVGYFQLARKIGAASDVIQHLVPLLVGLGVFVFLFRNKTSVEFTSDAVAELTRVTWPTKKEVRLGTIVVIITVILAGIILGGIDLAFGAIIRSILGT